MNKIWKIAGIVAGLAAIAAAAYVAITNYELIVVRFIEIKEKLKDVNPFKRDPDIIVEEDFEDFDDVVVVED
ncbi:MAG: hypothetical protein IKM51_02240 [Oscillospiraceae bacterium]|nr:hypothetical protein [Oscillospiraceae bacterium]